MSTETSSRPAHWTIGSKTFMGRVVGKCRSCKTVIARESMMWSDDKIKCECGTVVTLRGVWGKLNEEKHCSDKCMGATGPACECACGGENHGGIHL
jgi:hypothetical protein